MMIFPGTDLALRHVLVEPFLHPLLERSGIGTVKGEDLKGIVNKGLASLGFIDTVLPLSNLCLCVI